MTQVQRFSYTSIAFAKQPSAGPLASCKSSSEVEFDDDVSRLGSVRIHGCAAVSTEYNTMHSRALKGKKDLVVAIEIRRDSNMGRL